MQSNLKEHLDGASAAIAAATAAIAENRALPDPETELQIHQELGEALNFIALASEEVAAQA